MLTVQDCSETDNFRHLSNSVFRSLQFRKEMRHEDHLFLRKGSKLNVNFTDAADN